MATNKTKDESKEIETIEPEVLETPAKKLIVLCERGEFWYDGVRYHHDALGDETAQMLIDKGYTQIKFQ